jgi:hypothetical protein
MAVPNDFPAPTYSELLLDALFFPADFPVSRERATGDRFASDCLHHSLTKTWMAGTSPAMTKSTSSVRAVLLSRQAIRMLTVELSRPHLFQDMLNYVMGSHPAAGPFLP